jgi:hypothetical protein
MYLRAGRTPFKFPAKTRVRIQLSQSFPPRRGSEFNLRSRNIGRGKGQPAISIGHAKPVTMVGVKGNNGKASGTKTFTEVLILVAIAIVVVASIKTFATSSPWQSKATIEEHQGQQAKVKATSVDISISSAIEAGKDATDKNLIQFVFGNLDGVKGNDGAYQV